MLRRLLIRDLVIVEALELEFDAGFSVLTGETGAGKSILIDALQLALGARADAALVREGAARAEVSAEFDRPAALQVWLAEAGFSDDDGLLLLRRSVDHQGRSRAWINGSAATAAQLREAAAWLLDIHGQHAWQGLTQAGAVRALLDVQAGVDGAALTAAWRAWRDRLSVLEAARTQHDSATREHERLAWQLAEIDRLDPREGEWEALNEEHQRLSHGQALIDAARHALDVLDEGETTATALASRAADALAEVTRFDARLAPVGEVLQGALAQLEDAAHTLHAYLGRLEPDPGRLAELDSRLAAWLAMARRWRRPAAELPALREGWRAELTALQSAVDLEALQAAAANAQQQWHAEAMRASTARQRAAPPLAAAVTAAMQTLGMDGGRFEVALTPLAEPAAQGLESVEFLVAGHTGSTPRPLARVASGGELSRLALAIAVTTAQAQNGAMGSKSAVEPGSPPTLIFDEIDAGIGGRVADSVGRLLQRLGRSTQVLAVTHLAQVAACANQHWVVSKSLQGGATTSAVQPVAGETRVSEIARMLGGERLAGSTSRAHAQAMLGAGNGAAP